jgi:hypothetical protein
MSQSCLEKERGEKKENERQPEKMKIEVRNFG